MYFNDASENAEPINSDVAKELEVLIGNNENVTSSRFGTDPHTVYIFDNEDELYSEIEKKDKKIGRKLHFFYRLEQIQDYLTLKYGVMLDYRNEDLINELRLRLNSAYAEFKVVQLVPVDLTNFFHTYQPGEVSFNNHSRGLVHQFWEHENYTGQSFIGENVGTFTTYGPFGCYTTCSISDLQNVPKGSGNFNDCITSFKFNNAEGADATALVFHKNSNFSDAPCAKEAWVTNGSTIAPSVFIKNFVGYYWCVFGGKMNDNTSSIRSKACWKGCSIDFDDVD